MISEDEQNSINKALAIMFTVDLIMRNGEKYTRNSVDQHEDPEIRAYYRSLIAEALKIIETEGFKIPE